MKKLITVPYIDQTSTWPTGCESVSAVMLLNYLGIAITVDDFIEKYLDCFPFFQKDGRTYGADPHKQFAGTPYDSESFGCYASVIVSALNRVFTDRNASFRAQNVSGTPMENLQQTCIDLSRPVIFWSCLDLKPMIKGPSWYLKDGTEFTWRSNEHCMLWVGYGDTQYYFNDPWMNHGTIAYDKKIIEARHKEQYEMAVTVMPITTEKTS